MIHIIFFFLDFGLKFYLTTKGRFSHVKEGAFNPRAYCQLAVFSLARK
jgi:hypothetical protein